ncbi:hypothetical protein [Maribellus mangrovi]|uniref:hypothetical protein n=1 Tax=Maribellus mangrovi TaxID=3133146 RepID=UPI0030EC11EF
MYDYDVIRYRLIELALDTMNVKYESGDYYTEDKDGKINDSWIQYSIENIEEIKDACPLIYDKFKNTVINSDE